MRLPYEDGHRRRIYLMRHAEADYYDERGQRRPDPRIVPLTVKGRTEASAMGAMLEPVNFDRAICSGLNRTLETAKAVLGGRDLTLEVVPDLEEIRGSGAQARAAMTPAELAYMMFRAGEPAAQFAAGENFQGFRDRVLPAFEVIVADPNWTTLLLVCHGGTNRAILTWFLGLGLSSFGQFEQDSCCLNVLDFDQLDDGTIVRKIVRGINITAYDPGKSGARYLTLEGMAQKSADALARG